MYVSIIYVKKKKKKLELEVILRHNVNSLEKAFISIIKCILGQRIRF